jgi:hypothetical protein
MNEFVPTAMRRSVLRLLLIATALAPAGARAHFLFVLPDDDGLRARVILSEDLAPDDDIDPALVDRVALVSRDPAGREHRVTLATEGTERVVRFARRERIAIHGSLTHGVMKHGPRPFLVVYHPKACVGYPFGSSAHIGADAPTEIVPAGHPGTLRFLVLARGEPVAAAAVTVIQPDGTREEVETDADGLTREFVAPGRYGAWARHVEPRSGEHDGVAYAEVRHYPTLVIDVPRGHAGGTGGKEAPLTATERLPPLPEPASSLGVVGCGGSVYVYGGHIAPVHTYATDAVSGRFHRLRAGATSWEELPGGPSLQGMNLAAYDGRIYRVGGMEPRNAPRTPAENWSVASAACFDPARNAWSELPPLPVPRSSHDVAVIGSMLYVVGGWTMRGHDGEEWCDTMLALDLTATDAGWREIPQPFKRRALIAAVAGGMLCVIGGFTDDEEASRRVDVFDPATGAWSTGPELPGDDLNGFAPAACTVDGVVHVSTADGSVHALATDGDSWEPVARVRPRIVHRAVADGPGHLLLVGGAAGSHNLDLVERVAVR